MNNLICTHCGTEHRGDKLVYRCEHCGGVLKECLVDGKYKFRVSRVSALSRDIQPCKEAEQKTYFYIDWRVVDDPVKILAFKGETDWWYNEGTNHRVENGQIARDLERKGWFVEFNGIDDLLKFANREGDVIITDKEQYNYEILIYDTWIE